MIDSFISFFQFLFRDFLFVAMSRVQSRQLTARNIRTVAFLPISFSLVFVVFSVWFKVTNVVTGCIISFFYALFRTILESLY